MVRSLMLPLDDVTTKLLKSRNLKEAHLKFLVNPDRPSLLFPFLLTSLGHFFNLLKGEPGKLSARVFYLQNIIGKSSAIEYEQNSTVLSKKSEYEPDSY